jgi:hypothetical protein
LDHPNGTSSFGYNIFRNNHRNYTMMRIDNRYRRPLRHDYNNNLRRTLLGVDENNDENEKDNK